MGRYEALAEQPICDRCGVEYIADYAGPCQEPNCNGRVSYEATVSALASQLRGAVERIEALERELRDWQDAAAKASREVIALDREVAELRRQVGGRYDDSPSSPRSGLYLEDTDA